MKLRLKGLKKTALGEKAGRYLDLSLDSDADNFYEFLDTLQTKLITGEIDKIAIERLRT